MTSFDYAYKLEAVRDWLFAQTKLSTPLFVLLLPCLSYNHCFLKSNLKCTTCQKWCIVSKHCSFATPETPFDTYVSIRCFVFYALKALRRNTSSYHIIAVCFTVLKKRAFDPLQ